MKDRIKELRKHLKLTQTEFGQKIGLSRDGIASYERGIANPTQTAIMMIAKEFNVNEEWLRTGEGEMFRKVSDREELAAWVAEINALPTSSIQRRIAHMLTMLEPQDWVTLDKIVNAMIDNKGEE